MENYIPMTVAEGVSFASLTSQTMAVILAAEMTMVFAYLAGLYLFIRQARLPLRVFTHILVLMALGYFWLSFAFQLALNGFVGSNMDMSVALGVIAETGDGFTGGANTYLPVFEWLMHLIQLFVVVGVTYLAFFFDWAKPVASK